MLNLDDLPSIPIYENVTYDSFREEIYPLGRPAILKGYVSDWPIVKAASKSTQHVSDYLKARDTHKPVPIMHGPEDIKGQFFYSDDLQGLNFTKVLNSLSKTLDEIEGNPSGAVYIQSVPTSDILSGYDTENPLDIVDSSVGSRIWIGNKLTVQTHFDLSENIACVVAGRRRFTLFPPNQIKNLYIGPFEKTLAGPPISMVKLNDIDHEKYPNFSEALEHGMSAELAAGDAIYIPYFWWHHVQSLEEFNILVNYWWSDMEPDLGSPYDALLHALISFRGMPERQRKVWQDVFAHLVFQENGDAAAHLPKDSQGVLGEHTSQQRQHMRKNLVRALAYQAGIVPQAR